MNITQITPDVIEVSARMHAPTTDDATVTDTMLDSDVIIDLVSQGIEAARAGMPIQVLIGSILTSGVRLGWYVRDDMGAVADVERLIGVSEEDIRASIAA